MGSLPMNGNAMSKFVSIPSSGTNSCSVNNSFRERSKNRSPIQSPPLPKRILHFLETGKLGSKISSDGVIARRAGNHETSGRNKENRPILKSSSGSPHRRARSTADRNRKVSFRAKVVVFHFDREQGGHVHCESQTLNNEPDSAKNGVAVQQQQQQQQQQQHLHRQNNSNNNALTTFVSSAAQRQPHGGSIPTNRNDHAGHSNGTPTIQRRSLPPLQRNHREESSSSFPAPVVVVKDLNFQYSVDESRNSVLRFSLPLGPGTSAGDVVVKANKNGDRVRVFSSSSGGGGGGDPGAAASGPSKSREICERFALPVRVDSYRINARIDAGGVLFVEAPILSTESLPPQKSDSSHLIRKAV